MPRRSLNTVLSLLMIALASPGDATANEATLSALASISSDDLQNHVDVLADDMLEGREAGSRGGRAAGMYLVGFFEKYGLRPAGDDGGFFQPFQSGYRNIVGILEGSDPELKHEYVLMGAHYDHVGYGSRRNSFGPTGYIHNGADDNASGTSAMLELIEAFNMLPNPPRRSIIFALWDGEELGLLGSKHWVENPTVSLSQVCTAFNCDMIGRLRKDGLKVYGTRSSQGLRRLVSQNNRDIGIPINFDWEMKANSDHWPFFQHNIPVMMFHTGLHDDYHRPSDDAELVNKEGMQQVTHLLFNVAYDLAHRSERLTFRERSEHETVADKNALERELPKYPPRLGVWWDLSDLETAGIGIKRVVTDSAAARGRIQAGDRVIRFNGQPVTSHDKLSQQVLWSPTAAEVVVKRDGLEEPLALQVDLAGSPVRVGISWREDTAEPGTVLITRIVAGSPAQRAGLRIRDRIYSIAGHGIATSDALSNLLKTSPSPLELLVERDGVLRIVVVEVPAPR